MSGAEYTNNGWKINDNTVRLFVGNDSNGAEFQAGDVATVFDWLFTQIHTRVENVTMLNGWRSVAGNSIAGGDPGSNHLSGTAGDVNGFKHPYEPKLPVSQRGRNYNSGWSIAQQNQIRKILAESGGLFSWGLDYNVGWRDAMHFDITKWKTPAQVHAFARRVAPPTPKPPIVPDIPEDAEVSDYRLYRITDDGRVFLGGPNQWAVIRNATTLNILVGVYGSWIDVDVATGQDLDDTFTP